MKSKYNKSIGDHNISSGNELGSHNFNLVKFPEVASAIIACAAVGIVLSALVWLVVRHGNEVGMAVVVLAVLVFVSIVVLGSVIVTCVCYQAGFMERRRSCSTMLHNHLGTTSLKLPRPRWRSIIHAQMNTGSRTLSKFPLRTITRLHKSVVPSGLYRQEIGRPAIHVRSHLCQRGR